MACRAGTENVAAIVGMSVALKANTEQIEMISEYIMALESQLINELNGYNIDYIRNGSENHIPAI